MSEQLRRDLEKATTDRKGLLAQIESLRAQSATESQSLNQVKKNLDEAETIQATLVKEKENLQSLLTAECQTSSQSRKKVESLETELASVRETLERTQLDLTQSRKVNEEQAATDAASRAATTAETTRLLERIRQLEEQSRFSFLNAFVGGIMGLVEHVALWATGGRWPRRGNGTEVDRV
jgi:septation ring formation regulator EzrA